MSKFKAIGREFLLNFLVASIGCSIIAAILVPIYFLQVWVSSKYGAAVGLSVTLFLLIIFLSVVETWKSLVADDEPDDEPDE